MLALFSLSTILFAAVHARRYTPEALKDIVVNLPGAENLNITFNQFSGYLAVNGTKQMHYWLVESMQDPINAPIAFWTNGGPGCSGLLGFLTEQGPFRPNADMTLTFNQYAWNQVSNMVFIESPCGVGFSYSSANDTKADYTADDASTAQDNYDLIQAFFVRFPDYIQNSLYISSESYGGHYMPTLAQKIVNENTAAVNPHLNFKGFAVGNAFTTFYSGIPASVDTYWGHQVVAKPTYDKYLAECINAIKPNITQCEDLYLVMYFQTGDLNPYALDWPVCLESSPAKRGRMQRTWFFNHLLSGMEVAKNEGKLGAMRSAMGLSDVENYVPCEEDYASSYLNLPAVKAALHMNPDIVWEMCSRSIRYDQKDGSTSMVPIYQYLIDGKYGLNILVFSGDDDSVCGTIGTQDWIWDMGYSVAGKLWQPQTFEGQTSGYLTKWADTKLGFLTVHRAGHEVPAYTPDVALDLWTRYLAGEYTDM